MRRIDPTFDLITGGMERRRSDDLDMAIRGFPASHNAHMLLRCNEVMMQRAEEIDRLRALLAAAEARVRLYGTALNDIASWGEGKKVGPSFEEPAAAETARDALGNKPFRP